MKVRSPGVIIFTKNAVVSEKSPHLFSFSCRAKAFSIDHKLHRRLRKEIKSDTHTHTHTDRPTKYSNPRCACAPRVNYMWYSYMQLYHTRAAESKFNQCTILNEVYSDELCNLRDRMYPKSYLSQEPLFFFLFLTQSDPALFSS